MEPGEALGIAAQIAVALAGFAGVVVVFRSGSLHEWPPIDKYRLWLLLSNAVLPLVLCLFAILLLTIRPTPLSIWHWCSAFPLGLKHDHHGKPSPSKLRTPKVFASRSVDSCAPARPESQHAFSYTYTFIHICIRRSHTDLPPLPRRSPEFPSGYAVQPAA